MSEMKTPIGPAQPIKRVRVLGEFIASFVATFLFYSIVEGAIEHLSGGTPFSWKIFEPSGAKLLTMLTISTGWTILRVIQNHNKLLETLNSFITRIAPQISEDFERRMCETGSRMLRETLIEAVMSEGMYGTLPKITFHAYALQHFRELRSFEEELAPAIDVLARNRLRALRTQVANLKNDQAFDPRIEGHEQIEMSEAFAEFPARKIVFYDPRTYDDIEKNWSASFKVFISRTITKSAAEKIQYLLLEDAHFSSPKQDPRLTSYSHRMKGAGFKVIIIPRSSLVEVVTNVNYAQRLEIYDNSVAMKIESRSDYKDADKPKHEMSITLRAVRNDSELQLFLRALEKHSPTVI
jgi:hypothetical protein